MFLECKTVVQLAIGLDLTTNQGLIRSDYLILRNMEMASRVLKENRKNLEGIHENDWFSGDGQR